MEQQEDVEQLQGIRDKYEAESEQPNALSLMGLGRSGEGNSSSQTRTRSGRKKGARGSRSGNRNTLRSSSALQDDDYLWGNGFMDFDFE